ncbi:lysophospholipid acyltransferase family protein [Limnochorda pilosa]|uniref:1-acyl-sn-glycerol-3-phosphate acyltransferase n=1 Tax=Limnochorda pilosa TaxID=1555112 RepID=A0A0K2SKT3_LIMPI|nr:lysophospholipid acyltransferase family protein [Limnochorda pilosa]BAS27627.1 1-acyl-sn-glycerol-3-phosphate acyltransferase [Limnochorda pilosa]
MLYGILKPVVKAFLWRLFRIQVEGVERIPSQGPAILAANHVSWVDAILVAALADRPVYFVAKQELFRIPVLGFILRRVYLLEARRDGRDQAVLRRALQALREGNLVGLFPEGHRSRTGRLQEARGGAALLALHAAAPVVPVGVSGADQVYEKGWFWHRRPVRVLVGHPVDLGGRRIGRVGREEIAEASGRIMGAISSLLEAM